MEGKNYYSLTTRRFTLRCNRREWLESTQLFYNQILLFYYNLFLDLAEAGETAHYNTGAGKDVKLPEKGRDISGLNSQQLLRELERRTIVGRDKKPVPHPLPWSRVPLYFRRAAANAGIAAGKSFLAREEQKFRAESFHESVTFYKGTYRDFDSTGITLRVWTGEEWRWLRCRLSGNRIKGSPPAEIRDLVIANSVSNTEEANTEEDNLETNTEEADLEANIEEANPVNMNSVTTDSVRADMEQNTKQDTEQETELLSPSVVLKPEGMSLHVPVRERVEKIDNARKRMGEGTKLCCVQFTNGDSIAVCTALDRDNRVTAVRFLKGGSQYRHSCKRILGKLEKSRASTTGQERQENLKASATGQERQENLKASTTGQEKHEMTKASSTEQEKQENTIVPEGRERLKPNQKYWLKLQNISVSYAHQISRQITDFACEEGCGVIILPKYEDRYSRIVMKAVGNWSSLHLSNRISSQLSYKAWQQGILVLEADANRTGSSCAKCGAPVKRNGEEFSCPNGHKGNRYVNTCVNLGRKCRESFEHNGRTCSKA